MVTELVRAGLARWTQDHLIYSFSWYFKLDESLGQYSLNILLEIAMQLHSSILNFTGRQMNEMHV